MAKKSDKFADLGLKPWITNQVEKLGIRRPTPIQVACIPPILQGQDCIGAAKTGSGKTFAFALPILHKLSEEPTSNFALVLTPTHELAHQISEQFSVAGQAMGVKVCVVTGGTDQLLEAQRLQSRPHIVVAMPGRLAAHLTGCNTFSFRAMQFLVVDEADRVLSGNFDEDLQAINKFLPKKRQNLFFSATLKDFTRENSVFPITDDAFQWSEESEVATVETLDQRYILCADYDRDMVLIEALRKFKEEHEEASVIIFTNSKKDCQVLSMTLNNIGFNNVCLHGFLRQKERVAALNKFKSKHVRILIATDVASRGLDIPNVQLVLNHRLPKVTNEYIHRVGRTARAGRKGLAISVFRFPRDLEFLGEIEALINTKLTEHSIDQRLVERIFMQVSVARREAEMKLDNKDFDERQHNYRRKKWIADGLDPDEMELKWKQEQEARGLERKRRLKEENKKRKQMTNKESIINPATL
ncbi:probable ATP-dependent RNA helicase Dbp45A [Toxorhynchites rutilus septentrionalis]|uniref:probable ATP-dependent RNA helicase Dbp45A n=1 Tax=Toxorhynchites rutilus septentrionalis TaxID=329112 RepID=UPI0024785A33|nr:probable ATP-dependent RNA helicase Dbp45A [Toxorhynchites rutilus septentrionalis]